MDQTPWWQVEVPKGLLRDTTLPLRARFLYMLLASLCSPGQESCLASRDDISAISGIQSRRGLLSALNPLVNRRLLAISRQPGPYPTKYHLQPTEDNSSFIPAFLVQDRKISPEAKVLYAVLATHGQLGSKGVRLLQPELQKLVGFGTVNTLRRYARQLVDAGWLRIVREGGRRTSIYTPLDPHLATRRWVTRNMLRRMERQDYMGEAIMKEMLTLLIPDIHYEDNARPGFIINPTTQERLEVDRFYTRARVAFEFNGPQHYQTTAKYPSPEAVQAQRARDLIKTALLSQHNIKLVTIHAEDLSFPQLRGLVGTLLPTREVRLGDPVAQQLKVLGLRYRRKARQGAQERGLTFATVDGIPL